MVSPYEVTSTYGEWGPWLKTLPDGPLNGVDERWILFDAPSSQISGLTTQRKVQGNLLFYPCTRSGAAICGERLSGSHHLNDLVESIIGNMGELRWDVKESEK
jgi:hypothetical protein